MIRIEVGTNGSKVYDKFTKDNVTLGEVAVVLLKLKQIEHELINIEFDDYLIINT